MLRRTALLVVAATYFSSGLLLSTQAEIQEMRLPYDTHWPLIPENQGINFFLGKWYPTDSSEYEIFNFMTLHENGRITYGNNYPVEAFYKIVSIGRNYVLLFEKEHHYYNSNDDFTVYHFMFLHAPPDGYVRLPESKGVPPIAEGGALWVQTCGESFSPKRDEKRQPFHLGEDHWQLPTEKLLDVWNNEQICNPNSQGSRSSPKYPIGQWWSEYKYQR